MLDDTKKWCKNDLFFVTCQGFVFEFSRGAQTIFRIKLPLEMMLLIKNNAFCEIFYII